MAKQFNQTKQGKYVMCRSLRHAWDTAINPESDATLVLICIRCETERYSWFDARGTLIRPHRYRYPKDYKLGKEETPSTEQWRLLLMARLRGQSRRR